MTMDSSQPSRDSHRAFAGDSDVARVLRYLDGITTDRESRALEADLSRNAELRRLFREVCTQHVLAADCLSINSRRNRGAPVGEDPRSKTPAFIRWPAPSMTFTRWSAVAAVLVVIFSATTMHRRYASPKHAQVVESIDASWSDESLSNGAWLPAETVELRQGLAQLQFSNGSNAIFEAPCRFSAVSGDLLRLFDGKASVSCRVDGSTGFVVQTDHGEIEDLGTEFGVSASRSGVDLGVFDGLVEARFQRSAPRRIAAGEGLRYEARLGAVAPTGSQQFRYVRDGEFAIRKRQQDGLLNPSEASLLSRLHSDNGLIAWLDFRTPTVANLADPNRHSPAGLPAVSESLLRPGRRPSFKSYGIAKPEHTTPFVVPGEHKSLTLIAWMKFYPEGSGKQRRGLLMADHWDEPGEVHWQRKGNDLRLSVRMPGEINGDHLSFAAESPLLMSDDWLCLATTIDLAERRVRHFVNGEEVSQLQIEEDVPPLRLGSCSVGGWTHNPSTPEDRSMYGAVDQIAIWQRALEPHEVGDVYQATR